MNRGKRRQAGRTPDASRSPRRSATARQRLECVELAPAFARGSWGASFRFCACIGTMNPPLTPPRRGTDRTRTDACSPPGRGRGWVGSWRGSQKTWPIAVALSPADSWLIFTRLQSGNRAHDLLGHQLIDFLEPLLRTIFCLGAERFKKHRLAIFYGDTARPWQLQVAPEGPVGPKNARRHDGSG